MISKVYMHSKNYEQSNIVKYICLLIPFFLFGLYKNGISLYINNSVGLIGLIKPILLLIIAIIVSLVFSFIYKESYISYRLIANILISLITFPTTNIIIFLIIISLMNFLTKFIKFNITAGYMVIYSMYLLIINKFTFLNIYESNYELKLSFLNYLFGKGPGGISNTFLIFTLIAFIILLININYKKMVPIFSLVIYYIVILTVAFIKNYFDPTLLLNNNLLFAVIFVSTLTIYSPYTKGGIIVYGLLLGIGLVISAFININVGIYLVVLILSILSPIFDKLTFEKTKNTIISKK